jgi:hypothetical protein
MPRQRQETEARILRFFVRLILILVAAGVVAGGALAAVAYADWATSDKYGRALLVAVLSVSWLGVCSLFVEGLAKGPQSDGVGRE